MSLNFKVRSLRFKVLHLAAFVALINASCVFAAEPFDRAKLAKIDTEIEQAIAEGKLPGGVLWLEHKGNRYHKAYGDRAVLPEEEPMTKDTVFDLASLTKVIATTSAIMLLIERGQIKLDEPAVTSFPEFKTKGKDRITIRHLLTHVSGLAPDVPLTAPWSGYEKGIELTCAEKPMNPAGTFFRYSDINFITLGEIVRRVSGTNLDAFVAKEIFGPLKMNHTRFRRIRSDSLSPTGGEGQGEGEHIAPTERESGKFLRGVVHDPTARRMGGVAGHAGLFSAAADLARFARMMLNLGQLEGVRIFKPETVKLMTSVQSPEETDARRGLGWDIDSGYSRPRGDLFPLGSYGHTGFTGTSIWIDPFSETFWIFLSNRVHPDGKGNILPLQKTIATLAAEAITDFDFASVSGSLTARKSRAEAPSIPLDLSNDVPGVLNGIDVLARDHFAILKGKKVGLITNHTGKNRQRYPTIDLLLNAPEVELKILFSPEHGLYGNVDEPVGDSVDEKTGLPIFSLYGKHRAPTPEQLKAIDTLVFDIQDIGCRFYTYTSTMGMAMEAAAKAGMQFVVLDRVDPINGLTIDGPLLTGKPSFVGYYRIPVRYGMTIGELARMYKVEQKLSVNLTVIPVEGWKREQLFDATALPWVNPSPNMRSLTEAILYPGVGLLETTALSVGRGTGTPFELVGAPYIHDIKLAAELNKAQLKGVRFIPIRFTPTDSTFKGQACGGVSILLLDREHCEVVDIGILIAKTLHRLYPQQFDLDKFDRLLGNKATIDAIKAGKSLTDIRQNWQGALDEFKTRRKEFLLYK